MHKSVQVLENPEFINLQPLDLSPMMSSCEIKVLYLGENRNHSFISKEVAINMAKTLRGCPIVGAYREEKKDFTDHGERIIIDDEGVKFSCATKPYGFVAPDAKVWFQKFEDYDDFGNKIVHEYLMTTGYLWTGQFEECQIALDEGRPHSMELDDKTLDGKWSINNKTNIEFFIINDATFSKLCILGDDVEPCFEGSSVTSLDTSSKFTKVDDTFKHTLYSMMQDLKNFALKGGLKMENIETPVVNKEVVEQEKVEPTNPTNEESVTTAENVIDPASEYEKKEEKKEEENSSENKEEAPAEKEENKDDKEDKETKKKYELLLADYQTLQSSFDALKNERDELLTFKRTVEDAKKDELIDSFYMLSDEDKADVKANKSNYSLDDIEAKLSVICFRKKINFNDSTTESAAPAVTFNLESIVDDTPAWVRAVEETQKARNI